MQLHPGQKHMLHKRWTPHLLEAMTLCNLSRWRCLVWLVITEGVAVIVVVCVMHLEASIWTSAPPQLEWWKTSIVYQIYPRSFQDSDTDGVGDLEGVIQRLDYFQFLNVKAIWISPVFESPMKDFGYDISNFTNIDPIFGNLSHMTRLINEAHERGIKVIIDFVPNHTSNQHTWFIASERNDSKYRDYYIWADGRKTSNGSILPPNNWLSKFKNSAWQWSYKRKQFYYHAYLKEQPDLNYRNQAVVEEMRNVLRFWLDRKVDGFRVDALSKLFEEEDLSKDEPPSNRTGFDSTQWGYLHHIYTVNLMDDINRVLSDWRRVLDEYATKDGISRLLLIEATITTPADNVAWHNTAADMVFYFGLSRLKRTCGGHCIWTLVQAGYYGLRADDWANFVLGSHDKRRVSTRKGRLYVDVLNMLLLTLPGTPTTYYGEEIGMTDVTPSFNQTVDPQGKVYGPKGYLKHSRDPERSPMQWSATYQAGFSNSSHTWLPVGGDFQQINVQIQKRATGFSHLKLYRRLARLREEPAFSYGGIKNVVVSDDIFSYLREHPDVPSYLVILNVGKRTSCDNYSVPPVSATRGVVVATTEHSEYELYDVITLSLVELDPGQGLVIKL